MKDQINARLTALNAEYEAGQKMLAELDARRATLTSTLLRIEGAIQVLKEMAGTDDATSADGPDPGHRD